mmetsp:Transcript_98600/g.277256  ORF Transcript_98600/g.277256 Transcript_98600/m.277256 type:complete len:225 (-) Transcript_98600:70-744(-)
MLAERYDVALPTLGSGDRLPEASAHRLQTAGQRLERDDKTQDPVPHDFTGPTELRRQWRHIIRMPKSIRHGAGQDLVPTRQCNGIPGGLCDALMQDRPQLCGQRSAVGETQIRERPPDRLDKCLGSSPPRQGQLVRARVQLQGLRRRRRCGGPGRRGCLGLGERTRATRRGRRRCLRRERRGQWRGHQWADGFICWCRGASASTTVTATAGMEAIPVAELAIAA